VTKQERYFKNGLAIENREIIIKKIINVLIKNRLNYKFTDDQIIEVYCEAVEMREIEERVRLL
jgi:alkyl sulfatase BDS1-like metallo-beta-lactamase superfamily hydrolase